MPRPGLTRFAAASLSCVLLAASAGRLGAREADLVLPLWEGAPPGETRATGEERHVTGRPRPFFQITGIGTPALHVFHPPAGQVNGTAVLVCPGGGFQRLAWEHEGLEVAGWLNRLGVTAAVLKYRVPTPARTAAMDAQRALGLIRLHASDWGLDPDAIGFLGFSAGGEIGAWLVAHPEGRLYPPAGDADRLSARPDFAALVYPGGLVDGRTGTLREPVAGRLGPGLPPVFLAHAFDDSAENSLELARVLKRIGSPVELHLYPAGGHGFGIRSAGIPVGRWTDRFVEWLRELGHLDPAPMRDWARRTSEAHGRGAAPPRLTGALPSATLEDAYTAQRRVVRSRARLNPIDAFKGAAASATVQQALRIPGPVAAPLFRAGRIAARPEPSLTVAADSPVVVETEIAFVVGADIATEIPTARHARDAVEAVVAVIELPRSHPGQGPADAREMVAGLIGSDRYIVGNPVPADGLDPDSVAIRLHRDGSLLHEAAGRDAAGGQWENLRAILNSLTRAGYTVPAGTVVLGGALGRIHPGAPGRYEADFGPLGAIRFQLTPREEP